MITTEPGIAARSEERPPPTALSSSAPARIVRNVLALGMGQAFSWVSAAGLAVVFPHYLGDAGLGKLTIAYSLTEVCALLASMGVTDYLTKEIARREQQGQSDVLNAIVMRLPLAVLAALVAVLLAHVLRFDTATRRAIYVLCLNIPLVMISGVFTGALYGMQHMRLVAILNGVSKAVLLTLGTVALVAGYGLLGVAIAWNISLAVVAVGSFVALARVGGIGGRVDRSRWRILFTASMPFFVWQAALLVYGRVDALILAVFTRDAVVGWYDVAYRIVSIPMFVPIIVAGAIYPALSRSAHTDRPQFESIFRRSLQLVLLLTIPIAVGTIMISSRLLVFLHYPPEFHHSVPLIAILALHIPIVSGDIIVGNTLYALDKQRQWALTAVAAAFLNPALNVPLIPYFDHLFGNGAIAAATITVGTELFILVVGLRLLPRGIVDTGTTAVIAKCVAAAVLMAAFVWLTRGLPLPVSVACGGAIYCVASFAMGTLALRDVRLLQSYVMRRSAQPAVG